MALTLTFSCILFCSGKNENMKIGKNKTKMKVCGGMTSEPLDFKVKYQYLYHQRLRRKDKNSAFLIAPCCILYSYTIITVFTKATLPV